LVVSVAPDRRLLRGQAEELLGIVESEVDRDARERQRRARDAAAHAAGAREREESKRLQGEHAGRRRALLDEAVEGLRARLDCDPSIFRPDFTTRVIVDGGRFRKDAVWLVRVDEALSVTIVEPPTGH
jgi:hypothetical protein